MKRFFIIKKALLLSCILISELSPAQYNRDTSLIGVYLKNIYDLHPSEFSFAADFYIWSNCTDSLPLFEQIEIVNSKNTAEYSYFSDRELSRYITYENCKAQLTHNWQLRSYPFDRQKLQISVEAQNPQDFLFVTDDKSSFQISDKLRVPGWKVIKHSVEKSMSVYPTDFGYQNTKVRDKRFNHLSFIVELKRKSWGVYLKLFLGLHIAFLVSCLAFFVRPDYVDPRFGLSIGGLFASVANKYVVDANIPATIGFSFVDMVHFITFIAILATLVCSVFSLKLYSKGSSQQSKKLDKKTGMILAVAYIVINSILIIIASS